MKMRGNSHGMISLRKNIGGGGGSTEILILLAANVYLLPRKGYLQDALFAGGKASFAALRESG
jgi:hypothetical protein